MTNRHPSTEHMSQMLVPNPNLPAGPLAEISAMCGEMATAMIELLDDSPELTAGLRKLLEAKDCFVRAALLTNPVDYRDR